MRCPVCKLTCVGEPQVLYNTAIRARRREQIDQLLYAPEEILPECLERLHGSATRSCWPKVMMCTAGCRTLLARVRLTSMPLRREMCCHVTIASGPLPRVVF